ncbi:T9SS type A sorting domain-containing protein [Reichenbachiella ulvae]|uniref:T9SS type A sorting domain-containing protein n=1 Tax=Reichenbachiella ulvae TaxID=2980104 RepID=A0ABT3CSD3_9BACT|nr:T9SS type A sorting domain-containing protein [Reichenbachiella ulvae]MCV9386409.1 T9SS type A sorting domain-containing protein [Reichenbachiella ulvae]
MDPWFSNGYDLSVSGDFINDNTYDAGANTTNFNGGVQNISGSTSTTFNNLTVNSTTSLTLQNTISVSQDLSINTGFLNDNGNNISLEGDLYITTEHVSDGTGGIYLDNQTTSQTIYLPDNEAEVDLLYINNPYGASLTDNSATSTSLTIDVNLGLDEGNLRIEDNRLILDPDATVTTTDPLSFGTTRMISINGVKKSDGVEKEFAASVDTAPFVIPIGTPDKYTPVTLDVDNSDDPGSILIKPINSIHPSATGLDALNYYWVISTNPFTVSNFVGSISFQYEEEDANNTGQNESTWENKAARLITPSWLKPSGNLVDITNNIMTFTNSDLSSGGSTTFDGEFTIGNDLPNILAKFTSVNTGSWNVGTNWNVDRDADEVYNEATDDAPLEIIPQPGSIVVVETGHEMTMSTSTDNNQNIFSVEINGVLNIADTDGHNFGEVTGSGTLKTYSSTLPGGDYDAFFTTTDGALELAGSGSYTISPDFTAIRALTVSGGGTKTLPSFSLSIGSDGLTIDESTILDNSVNNNSVSISGDADIVNGTMNLGNSSATLAAQNFTLTAGTFTSAGGVLDLSGNLAINGGTFNSGSGVHTIAGNMTLGASATFNNNNGTFSFDGTTNQSLAGDFSSETFNNVQVNKSAGSLNLATNASVYISNTLTLDGGNLNTQATGATLRMTNGVGSITQNSGFVSGPLQVDLNDGNNFSFPVGKSSSFKPLAIAIQNASQSANPLTWEVEYYIGNPGGYSSASNTGIDINSIQTNTNPDEQVVNVYGIEYWRIDTPGGTATADQISLDISNTGLTTDQINDELIQVMTWNNTNGEWDHLGGTSTGVPSSANVTSTSTLSFNERIVTSGSEDPSALPVELISFTANLLEDAVEIKWSTASEIDNDYFVIERSTDGKIYEALGEVTGFGTTNERQDYSFIDDRPYFGISYYRLVQYDFDGTESIFGPLSINNDQFKEGIDLNLYPNPSTSGEFNLKINSGDENSLIQLVIYDMSGQMIYSNQYSAQLGTQIIPININNQSGPGIYHVKVSQGYNQVIQKLVIR